MNPLRRVLLLSTALAGLAPRTFSQEITSFQITAPSCDTLYVQISVFFPFGSGNACPPFSGFDVLAGDATAAISLYYDASGVWPQLGCTTTSTLAIPIPDGDILAYVGTYSIVDGDTSQLVSDTLVQLCVMGLGEITRTSHPTFSVQGDHLIISSVSALGPDRVEIFDPAGNLIRSDRSSTGRINIRDLPTGLYLARCRWPAASAVGRFIRP